MFVFLLLFFIASAIFTFIIILPDAGNAAHGYLIVYIYVRTEETSLSLPSWVHSLGKALSSSLLESECASVILHPRVQ
jgi:hypothetical protein